MNKQIGIVRNLDSLGRVVIPKEYRKILNLNYNDSVEIILIDDGIFIKKSFIENLNYENLLKNFIADNYKDLDPSNNFTEKQIDQFKQTIDNFVLNNIC